LKLRLIFVESKKEPWLTEARDLYIKKISRDFKVDSVSIKTKSIGRDDNAFKKQEEGERILKVLSPGEFLLLFDEGGKVLDSKAFSMSLFKSVEQGGAQIAVVIGGAFGVSDEVKKRANLTLSLSSLTLSHLTAQLVALEQIYRAICIRTNRPYHND
jgi:23S rRNA (pseudouridine1915-N3)-methyltransferase